MTRKRWEWGAAPILAAALIVATAGGVVAADGNLPGGTPISVEITSPPDGALIAHPPGDVQLEGTASIGEGTPVANTSIVYVVDVSGSTDANSAGDGCGGDANGDGVVDTILDCEVAAAVALNDEAIVVGTVAETGVAVFATAGASADVGPAVGDQPLTGPATDAGGTAGVPDVEEVLRSAFSQDGGHGGVDQFSLREVGFLTAFDHGVAAACSLVGASTAPNKLVVFMSDGNNNSGAAVGTADCMADFFAFAVGSVATCSDPGNPLGDLDDVADLGTGEGVCQQVVDATMLPELVPAVIAAQLTALELSIDGGAFADITASASPALPVTGPDSVTFSHTVAGLDPGVHELCVRARGADGGGEGTVTDCIEVTVADIDLQPEDATNELGTPAQTHTVTATVAAGTDGGVAGVSVDFEVLSGPNAGEAGSAITDGAGEASFTYTAEQGPGGLGTDVIEACFEDDLGDTACDQAEKQWVDTTAPEASCAETTNPSGRQTPRAGQRSAGQNEDGFYELSASDLVDPDAEIFLEDSVSGVVFGPFESGTRIKYTQAPGATPTIKEMGSPNGQGNAVDWHIIGQGDLLVTAVDDGGTVSATASCLVPPPPK